MFHEPMRRVDQAPVIRHGGNGRPKIDGEYWARPSTFAKTLDDGAGLVRWKQKMVARGVAISPDLQGRAATMPLESREWGDLCERAMDRAGASSGRDDGSSIHSLTEALDYGETMPGAPEWMVADAQAYVRTIADYELSPLVGEMFVANRELRVAGTFDRIVADENGSTFVLDIKTVKPGSVASSIRYQGMAWAIQTYCYATGLPYDGVAGWGTWEAIGVRPPSTQTALVAVIERGAGRCELVDIDLHAGHLAALLCEQVQEARAASPAMLVGVKA